MYVVVEDAGVRHVDGCGSGCVCVRVRMYVCKRVWRVVSCQIDGR